MSILLLKNKYRLQIKQVLLCSTCFVLFSMQVMAQKKWAAIDAGTTSGRNILILKTDTLLDKLVIGGHFLEEIYGDSTCSVFKWTPESGVEILATNDINKMSVRSIRDIYFIGDSMFVSGNGGYAIYHDSHWIKNVIDPHMSIEKVILYKNNYLLANGFNKRFQGQDMGQILNWDGDTTFSEFENVSDFTASNGGIFSVIEYKGEIYAGGNASVDKGGVMEEIMRWTGTEWTDLDGGILDVSRMGGVNDMIEYQGDLYIAGLFVQQNHSKENHIARWDGQQWLTVGGGIQRPNAQIKTLHVHDGYLYVGGGFDEIGGIPAQGIARWDGKEWCSCQSSFLGASVSTITHYRDTLYVGGNFNMIDGDTIYKIAKFIGDDFADTCGSVSVGIKTLEAEKTQIVGYPNPARDVIHLMLPELQNQEVEIQVYNQVGQLMFQRSQYLVNQKLQLDLSQLSQGMYFGELVTKNKNYVFSFVKE